MAKRIKFGSVKVDVKQADQDGKAINFDVKLFPWSTLVHLDSARGMCTGREGKTYIRFEDSDDVKHVVNEIKSSIKNRIQDNLGKILLKVGYHKVNVSNLKIVVDLSNIFNETEEDPALIVHPGQYTRFAAYNVTKKNLKEFKSVNSLLNYADLRYRTILSNTTTVVTVVDDDKGKITFICAPWINVKRIVPLFKTGKEKQYDPEKVSEEKFKLSKKKEESDIEAYLAIELKYGNKVAAPAVCNEEEVFSDDEPKERKSKKTKRAEEPVVSSKAQKLDRNDPEHVKFVEDNFPQYLNGPLGPGTFVLPVDRV